MKQVQQFADWYTSSKQMATDLDDRIRAEVDRRLKAASISNETGNSAFYSSSKADSNATSSSST